MWKRRMWYADFLLRQNNVFFLHFSLSTTIFPQLLARRFYVRAGGGASRACPRDSLVDPTPPHSDSKASWKNVGLCGVCIFFGVRERIKWTRWWRGWRGNDPQNFWARTVPGHSRSGGRLPDRQVHLRELWQHESSCCHQTDRVKALKNKL